MKIIGFSQLFNEYEKGNLDNWVKSMSFCDFVYIYDQNSTSLNHEIYNKQENNTLLSNVITGLKYENKKNVSDLLNPINFFLWLIFSLKDIF